MKTKLNKMSWTNRLILISILLVAITNPWSVGYIGSGIDTAVVYFTLYANYVFVVGLILLALVNIWMMYAGRDRVKTPPKTKNRQTKDGVKSKIPLIEL